MKKLLNTALFSIAIVSFSLNAYAENKVEKQPEDDKAIATTPLATEQSIFKEADQLWGAKKIDDAIVEYKKIITENPNNKLAYQRLASIYLLNNKAKDAIPAYQNAIIHDPENPKLFASMSIAYLHLSQYSMAKAMANQAVALDPTMENAKKIISYADKKVEVLEQAAKAAKTQMPAYDAAFIKKEMDKKEKTATATSEEK
jgi:cytochrome c-type biogenesis protein CcmH/NrfG